MAQRREKGLCYNCDEQFMPGHRCAKPQLFVVMTEDEEGDSLHLTPEKNDSAEEEEGSGDCGLSIHALDGTTGLQTLQLLGKLKNRVINILVDTGSTHNFISDSLIKTQRLHASSCPALKVVMANGSTVTCEIQIKQLEWFMQDTSFTSSFYAIPLQSYDMILGVQWMQQVSPIGFDFRKNQIWVTWEQRRLLLTQPRLSPTIQIQMDEGKEFSINKGGTCFLVQLSLIEEAQQESPSIPDSVKPLLLEFDHLFQNPSGLPPPRAQDHLIPLMEHNKPINLNPYKCSYIQKTEIEKLVREMLDSGIIRHSTSPYSSPVLLVKKRTTHGDYASIIELSTQSPSRIGSPFLLSRNFSMNYMAVKYLQNWICVAATTRSGYRMLMFIKQRLKRILATMSSWWFPLG